MLDRDNIISTSVSETLEKIPTNEKVYRKCTCVYFVQPQHTKSNFCTQPQTQINIKLT